MHSSLTSPALLLLLSGAVGGGKTSVAQALLGEHDFRKVSTSSYLSGLAASQGLKNEREILQRLGDDLDVATDFSWPVRVAASQVEASNAPPTQAWLLDAVRKPQQIAHFRAAFPSVFHVHITAPEDVLRARYEQRQLLPGSRDANGIYDQLISHPNEIASRGLASLADAVYDSNKLTAWEIAADIVRMARELRHGPSGVD